MSCNFIQTYLNAGNFDQNWKNVSLLMHMEGVNGSSSFIDSTGKNTLTSTGAGALISTAKSKVGNSSIALTGNGDYVGGPNKADYTFGTGDFTVEAWIYLNSIAGTGTGYQASCIVFGASTNSNGGGTNRWSLIVAFNGELIFDNAPESGSNRFQAYTNTGVIVANQWMHVAVVRKSGVITIYINGVAVPISTNYNGPAAGVYCDGPIRIGRLFMTSDYDYRFNGYIDELRITKGVARYTANFTPLTTPFPDQ